MIKTFLQHSLQNAGACYRGACYKERALESSRGNKHSKVLLQHHISKRRLRKAPDDQKSSSGDNKVLDRSGGVI